MDSVAQSGPFILRSLLPNIPVSEAQHENASITCVEFWNGNLYVGTSAAEILHYVLIPGDPDSNEHSTFIIASRLQPELPESYVPSKDSAGVQQILVLPEVSKACILCDGFLSFYILPELSPIFGSTKSVSCTFIGGTDLNGEEGQDQEGHSVPIMLCLRNRIRLIKIGDAPRKIRDIVFEGCTTAVRRDNIACIANSQSYSLLDVVEQQQIPLSPISSAQEPATRIHGAIATTSHSASSSISSPRRRSPNALDPDRGHTRATSLGNVLGSSDYLQPERSPRRNTIEQSGSEASELPARASTLEPPRSESRPLGTSATPSGDNGSNTILVSTTKELPPIPGESGRHSYIRSALRPHIASPTSTEFLFTTGSSYDEPGVGMFVNLDGEVIRGTLEFSRYPEAIVVDGKGVDPASMPQPGEPAEEGFVLAVMKNPARGRQSIGLEIQRWDLGSGEGGGVKHWLDVPLNGPSDADDEYTTFSIGLQATLSSPDIFLSRLSKILGNKLLDLSIFTRDQESGSESRSESNGEREIMDADYIKRLSMAQSRIVVWSHNSIWSAVRNPLVLRLDSQLPDGSPVNWKSSLRPAHLRTIEHAINSIRGQVAQTELEFFGLTYIRQKAALMLFMDALEHCSTDHGIPENWIQVIENSLTDGDIDPRVLLMLLPSLREEVLPGFNGIWLQGGLKELVEQFEAARATPVTPRRTLHPSIAQIIKGYLFHWRRKKGFGSISNEKEVFETVDAALLHLLLLIDRPRPGRNRSELRTVAEKGVDCFDRAVQLLEDFRRLYLLSILYQSRTMPGQVLATWRRILEGEPDDGGEFVDGEQQMRKYLTKIKDAKLVEEYGTWLANRNPKLGVRVFADDNSKVHFEPKTAINILQRGAPAAVQEYLEHLVFGKNLAQYANDLISYYLSSVLNELRNSDTARSALLTSYEAYRTLQPPKPTYSQFVTDNALNTDWWRNRLRLLQLLGGSHGAASQYDVPGILTQLEPFEQELVPEMIILDGRQGRHREAIRLLTHGLGDFDTAITYCLLGGANIYSPLSTAPASATPAAAAPAPQEDQAHLFAYLLEDFLHIDNVAVRLAQTSELLARFAPWFDAAHVLSLLPDEWGVEHAAGFLESALRRLVSERHETTVAKALVGVENLAVNAGVVEKLDALGPSVVLAQEGVQGGG